MPPANSTSGRKWVILAVIAAVLAVGAGAYGIHVASIPTGPSDTATEAAPTPVPTIDPSTGEATTEEPTTTTPEVLTEDGFPASQSTQSEGPRDGDPAE